MEAARAATAADLDRLVALALELRAELRVMRGGALWEAREARARAARRDVRRAARRATTRSCSSAPSTTSSSATARSSSRRSATARRLGVIGELYVEPDARAVGVGEAIATELVARADRGRLHRHRRVRAARPPRGEELLRARRLHRPGARHAQAAARLATSERRNRGSKWPSARSSSTTVACCSCSGGGERASASGRRRAAGSSSASSCATAVAREVREETGLTVDVGELAGWVERTGDAPRASPLRDPRLLGDAGRIDTSSIAGDDAADARWVPKADLTALPLVDGLFDFLVSIGSVPPRAGAATPARGGPPRPGQLGSDRHDDH